MKPLELRVRAFIDSCIQKYGFMFDYSLIPDTYVNNKSTITIKCKLHGPFTRRATDFLNGRICPICQQKGGKVC